MLKCKNMVLQNDWTGAWDLVNVQVAASQTQGRESGSWIEEHKSPGFLSDQGELVKSAFPFIIGEGIVKVFNVLLENEGVLAIFYYNTALKI